MVTSVEVLIGFWKCYDIVTRNNSLAMAQPMVSIPALCKLAAVNLWVNKVRSLLTISGMVFGTAAVIATLSSSEGAQRFVKKQLESLGANIITVYSEKGEPFSEQDIALIGKNSGVFDSIAIAAGIPATYEKSEFAPLGVNLPVVGYQTSGFKAATLEIDYGRIFDPLEERLGMPAVVLGAVAAKQLFGIASAVGQSIRIGFASGEKIFTVTGVLKEKGGASGKDLDVQVFVPYLCGLRELSGSPRTVLYGVLKSEKLSGRARSELRALFTPGRSDVQVIDAREAIEKTTAIWEKQNLVGIMLASVSLVTGGVGIMNIMLLSIHQRRKEIGLRKAVGANDFAIATQFLLESVIVCLFGGLIGVAVGWGFGNQVAKMLGQWDAVTSPFAIFLALGFAMATGVIFGLLPAMKAARLDPYEALRST